MSYSRPDSSDPAWKYSFWPKTNDKNCLECKLCGNRYNGGIRRMKVHLTGIGTDARKCGLATDDIQNEIIEYTKKKKRKGLEKDDDSLSSGASSKKLPRVGISIDANVAFSLAKVQCQTTVDDHNLEKIEERNIVIQQYAKWMYQTGVSFNAVKLRSFAQALEVVGHYGVVSKRWAEQCNQPLHGAGYFLNPGYYSDRKEVECDYEAAFLACVEIMIRSPNEEDEILTQVDAYKNARDLFGKGSTIRLRSKKQPTEWWDTFGNGTPELKRMALRILGLCCTSSAGDRKCVDFELYNQLRERFLIRQSSPGAYDAISYDEVNESREWLTGLVPAEDDDIEEDFSYGESGVELVFATAGDGLVGAQLLDENLNFIPLDDLVYDCF
ncbi:hypothetical protein RJ639_012788 [Escallonia herrerae]|uniref:BED-type domain-containing protein n=1 Tax=Escallonia herrerae TaxID=1293975 RepID=A0AA89ASN9_9ASTE|nr:hypothetical protein RJ639_012788 [Escallonia herrerae]